MQYILNEEEYLIFKGKNKTSNENALKADAVEVARKEILKLAEFTCIHDVKERYVGYCDNCPCSPLGHDYKTWDLICGQTRQYSK